MNQIAVLGGVPLGDATSRAILTFDIGGTHIRAALYDMRTETLTSRGHLPSPSVVTDTNASAEELWSELASRLLLLGQEVLPSPRAWAVAAAFPGR